jgi:cell wall-associated NlpC family hydrolase
VALTSLNRDPTSGAVAGPAALACRRVSSGSDTTVQPGSRAKLALSRRVLAGALALVAVAAVAVAALLLAGGGHSTPVNGAKATAARLGGREAHSGDAGRTGGATAGLGHGRKATQSEESGAGRSTTHPGAAIGAQPGQTAGRQSSATGGGAPAGAASAKAVAVAEVRDPEESKSFPLPASVHHRAASTPSVAGEAAVAPGAASDAQIRKELGEEEHAEAQQRAQARALTATAGSEGGSSVGGNGTIPIPSGVPEAVQRVVAGGNAIADFPYIWGGGHASFVANGYDCSGSVSYALAAGGLLSAPLVSGELAHWGEPGPGRWITIYANAGHTFMDVNGVWFDTAGRSGPYDSRWILDTPSLAGYAVRHPPEL